LNTSGKSLRKIILEQTGQDLRKCRGCLACDLTAPTDTDIGYGTLVQMVLMNDLDVLDSKLVWNNNIIESAAKVCNKQLNLRVVIETLRLLNPNFNK
jgi:flavoprotein